YDRSAPTITLTGIEIRSTSENGRETGEARVVWSRRLTGGAGAIGTTAGTVVTLPASLLVPGTFIVQSEAQPGSQPLLAALAGGGALNQFHGLTMHKTYYMRPRQIEAISCNDC